MLNGGEAKEYFDAGSAPCGFQSADCTPATPQCSLSGGWNNHPVSSACTAWASTETQWCGAVGTSRSGYRVRLLLNAKPGLATNIVPKSARTAGAVLSARFQIAAAVHRGYGAVEFNFDSAVTPSDEKVGLASRADWNACPAYTTRAAREAIKIYSILCYPGAAPTFGITSSTRNSNVDLAPTVGLISGCICGTRVRACAGRFRLAACEPVEDVTSVRSLSGVTR